MSFLRDNKAFGDIIYGAVGLVIFIIMIGTIVMPQILGAATGTWNAATIALWGVLPLCVIASAIMFVVGKK